MTISLDEVQESRYFAGRFSALPDLAHWQASFRAGRGRDAAVSGSPVGRDLRRRRRRHDRVTHGPSTLLGAALSPLSREAVGHLFETSVSTFGGSLNARAMSRDRPRPNRSTMRTRSHASAGLAPRSVRSRAEREASRWAGRPGARSSGTTPAPATRGPNRGIPESPRARAIPDKRGTVSFWSEPPAAALR